MMPGHRIRGRVVDEQKKVLANVDVVIPTGNRFPGIDLGGGTTTDVKGRF